MNANQLMGVMICCVVVIATILCTCSSAFNAALMSDFYKLHEVNPLR